MARIYGKRVPEISFPTSRGSSRVDDDSPEDCYLFHPPPFFSAGEEGDELWAARSSIGAHPSECVSMLAPHTSKHSLTPHTKPHEPASQVYHIFPCVLNLLQLLPNNDVNDGVYCTYCPALATHLFTTAQFHIVNVKYGFTFSCFDILMDRSQAKGGLSTNNQFHLFLLQIQLGETADTMQAMWVGQDVSN